MDELLHEDRHNYLYITCCSHQWIKYEFCTSGKKPLNRIFYHPLVVGLKEYDSS